MLIEELQPYIETGSQNDDQACYYLTINKTKAYNTWSAGYQDFTTGKVILGINNCESLEEVAIRLNARLKRFLHRHMPKPHVLQNVTKNGIVPHANVTGDQHMADSENQGEQQLTFGQKVVGISFNPSGDARVNALKQSAADMIDTIRAINNEEGVKEGTSEAFLSDYAIQSILTAQMAAVKRATWNLGMKAAPVNTSAVPTDTTAAPAPGAGTDTNTTANTGTDTTSA